MCYDRRERRESISGALWKGHQSSRGRIKILLASLTCTSLEFRPTQRHRLSNPSRSTAVLNTMAPTMITLLAALAASSIAAPVSGRFPHSSLVERASSVGIELYVYVGLACTHISIPFLDLLLIYKQNLGGQGCNIQHTGSSVTAVTVPLSDNGTCVTFSSLKVPFLVKSAESIAYPAGYNCQGTTEIPMYLTGERLMQPISDSRLQ